MTTPVSNKVPYIRNFRKFPTDDKESLATELTRGWIETANAVNQRVIGIISTDPTINGKSYYFNGQKFQAINQLFPISDSSLTITHGISSFSQITIQSGWFTDGTIWYPLPYIDVTNVTNQVKVTTTSTQILVVKGASAPSISSGFVLLEWLQAS
jgi:hypothetical protein